MSLIDGREMHGIEIAHELGMKRQNGYAALYKALRRLETHADIGGRLVSHWEDATIAEQARRPRRRLYRRAAQEGNSE